ncbi:serine dehydratase [Brachybacterium endophyticum]|uniref:threonine ammonia-lyase n=1 Tax=Brachybacterium endophyticum TaxID=2182385 RepID=A0A2U2RN80_9MICO|nr:pyridoxal-phosphate dependent enzyme [Brachybacterium endophyticum]PWH07323.1 serine dehydratase [Brachybacterium endophyticum]
MPVLTFAEVREATRVLEGVAHRTPVLTSRTLDEQTGCEMFLKAENLQRVGAFKFRGAFTALSALSPGVPVVAFSSGNHAQAVALAAREQGRRASIVMPEDSPASKLAATRGYGAEVITYDRYREDRIAIAEDLARDQGAEVIPPFDHPAIIAGQGTAALELFEEVGELDALLVPCGGGGLLSGSLLAAGALSPACRVYGVEPLAGDDVRRSLETGEPVTIDVPRTLADGAQTTRVGTTPFAIIRDRVSGILTAGDEQLVEEMRFLAGHLKTVVEPTGCLGLAAARDLAGDLVAGMATRGRRPRVGVILSGGNVDLDRFAALVGGGGWGDKP